MLVTKRLQDIYRSELDRLSEKAASYVESYINALNSAVPEASASELREATKTAIDTALNAFGTQAGALSAELFEEIMKREGRDLSAEVYETIGREDVDKKVRYFAGRLVEGEVPSFTKDVTDLTRYYVKREAFENTVRNCIKHEIRYARVPSGRETCAFCFMLSSRGFVYHTELSAMGKSGHGMHRHCDCIVVPGVKGVTGIDGYDPEAMSERWASCARTIGLDPKEPSQKKRAAIMGEVSKRDWKWLYEGKASPVTRDNGAKPLPKEEEAAKWLSEMGFPIHFRQTRSREGKKTSDVCIGGSSWTPWEIKQPKGSGKWNISNQFNEAKGQSSKLVLDVSKTPWDIDDVIEEAKAQLRHREEFDEVLILTEGFLKRLKK